MILQTGVQLGRYLLERRVGAGGMAEVWQALDTMLERTVALKVVSESVAVEQEFAKRFLREAQLAARLEHPNILPIYDFGAAEKTFFLVMPLLPGGTLRDRARNGVETVTAVDWLKAVGSALDYAHGEGVVHRDVKPANLLFDKNGRIYLADFGLARQVGGESMTVAGTVMGTPVYMSPEQVRGDKAGPRSDQYALGVLAYYLLTGTPPFEANSMYVVLEKTLREEPGLPSRVRPELHRAADYVLLKVLEKEPESRFPTCAAFVSALERALVGRVGTSPGTGPGTSPGSLPPGTLPGGPTPKPR